MIWKQASKPKQLKNNKCFAAHDVAWHLDLAIQLDVEVLKAGLKKF